MWTFYKTAVVFLVALCFARVSLGHEFDGDEDSIDVPPVLKSMNSKVQNVKKMVNKPKPSVGPIIEAHIETFKEGDDWCFHVGCDTDNPPKSHMSKLPSKKYILYALITFKAPNIGPDNVEELLEEGNLSPELTSTKPGKDTYQW